MLSRKRRNEGATMPKPSHAHAIRSPQHQGTPGEKQQRKKRVLNKDRSALVRSIAEAVVIKDQDLFFLCERDGRVPLGVKHGFGLYYHDCRFVKGYELHIADTRASPLIATAHNGFRAELELTNPDLRTGKVRLIQKEDLGIRWERVIDARRSSLCDQLTFQNYKLEPVDFPVTLSFDAAFEDIFAVRGMPAKKRGKLHPPAWHGGVLSFVYDGSDGVRRCVHIQFEPAPQKTEKAAAHFDLSLRARESAQLRISLVLSESSRAGDAKPSKQRGRRTSPGSARRSSSRPPTGSIAKPRCRATGPS
jgi:glycogen debranching enzyme